MTESLLTAERLDTSFGGRRVLRDVSVRISAVGEPPLAKRNRSSRVSARSALSASFVAERGS